MNATLDASVFSPAPVAASTKPLWAAVGVLSICVISMGASLVHVNKRVEPLARSSMPLASSYAFNSPAGTADGTANGTASTMITEEKIVEKPPAAPAKSAQSATKSIAKQAAPVVMAQAPNRAQTAPQRTAPQVEQAPAPTTTPTPAPTICKACGTIEAVTPITREAPASGVGVIAGGVLGGVVGNQIGKGNGRTASTVLGAIGGGWAGNAIEKNMKKTTAYSVRIRMEDGTRRTLEQSTAPAVGSKVTLDGNTMRPA